MADEGEGGSVLGDVLRGWLAILNRAHDIYEQAPDLTKALVDRCAARTTEASAEGMAQWAAFHVAPDVVDMHAAVLAGLIAQLEGEGEQFYAAQVAALREEIVTLRAQLNDLLVDAP